jgi:hypothetical protein
VARSARCLRIKIFRWPTDQARPGDRKQIAVPCRRSVGTETFDIRTRACWPHRVARPGSGACRRRKPGTSLEVSRLKPMAVGSSQPVMIAAGKSSFAWRGAGLCRALKRLQNLSGRDRNQIAATRVAGAWRRLGNRRLGSLGNRGLGDRSLGSRKAADRTPRCFAFSARSWRELAVSSSCSIPFTSPR